MKRRGVSALQLMQHAQSVPEVLRAGPYARAVLHGGTYAPCLGGTVSFYPWARGTLVKAEVVNLPAEDTGPFFGFHIHEQGCCEQDFTCAGGHFNPTGQQHPFHAGDLPVLLSNHGYAYMTVYTDRFRPCDVIGRSVIIHQMPDDYRSQPAGDSGNRIGCGVILRC